jgi:hypothetical protein
VHPDSGRQFSIVFSVTIFTSAFLLFALEPMTGKLLLPWFGGAPSVWITCVLFFQLLLLGGYAYAHLIATGLQLRRQVLVHLGAVTVCLTVMTLLAIRWDSPIMPPASWKPNGPQRPELHILLILCAGVGLPYFLLSTTAPLLQKWFANFSSTLSAYRLYALSNLGAMLGLLSYPFIVEPALSLHRQTCLWCSLFVVFGLGVAASAMSLRGHEQSPVPNADNPHALSGQLVVDAKPTLFVRCLWLALAACASLMFIAATNQLCEDIAAVPFLWVLPLSIYLLSFIVCFGAVSGYKRAVFNPALFATITLTCIVLYRPYTTIFWQSAVYSLLVGTSCMVCHGELVRLKPGAGAITSFYLMVSAGGALGGLFAAVLAPLLFRGYWELQLSIWGCGALLLGCLMRDQDSWIHERRPLLAIALLAAAVLLPEVVMVGAGKLASGLFYNIAAGGAAIVGAAVIYGRRQGGVSNAGSGFLPVSVAASLLMLASVLLSSIGNRLNSSVFAVRNFYGAFAVLERDSSDPAWHAYVLRHGRIVHGVQFTQRDKRRQPSAYYGPASDVGLLMLHHPRRSAADPRQRSLRVGVVGLGIGTIAAYGHPGDYMRFYEINPAMIKVAAGESGYFTYLRDSRARIEVVPGDGRLSMEREIRDGEPQRFDLLIIDAFSGDAIPMHLLTKEAMAVYMRELAPDGVVGLHVSNNYFDLRPIAARLAEYYGLHYGWVHSPSLNRLTQTSDWILLARNTAVMGRPAISANLRELKIDPGWRCGLMITAICSRFCVSEIPKSLAAAQLRTLAGCGKTVHRPGSLG